MKINTQLNIEFDKEQLCNAISNALFSEFTVNKNKKKLMEMNLMDLTSYLPEIIANEVIKDIEDIIKITL